jgi:signal transduction histidine kinase/Tfp pilus assembly protein PilF
MLQNHPLRFLFLTAWLCLANHAWSQPPALQAARQKMDQLRQQGVAAADTAMINAMNGLAFLYADSYPDSALDMIEGVVDACRKSNYREGEADAYKILGNAWQTKGNMVQAMDWYQKALQVAEKAKYRKGIPGIKNNIALIHMHQGNYPLALSVFYESLELAEQLGDKFVAASTINNIAIVQFYQGMYDEAEASYRKTLDISTAIVDTINIILSLNNIGETNLEQQKIDAALREVSRAHDIAVQISNPEMMVLTTHTLGVVYERLDSTSLAVTKFEEALRLARQNGYGTSVCKALIALARVQLKRNELKEALVDGLEGLGIAGDMGQTQLQRDASQVLAEIYERMGDGNQAIRYFRMYKQYADSINNLETQRAAVTAQANRVFSQKELEFQRQSLQQRWIIFSAFAGLLSLGAIALIVNRNRRKLNRAYTDLQQKNEVIATQKSKAELMLQQLQSAQAKLIQTEKMASLGELTAGIAHEIQNPLNFVNNFSDVNQEMLGELMDALRKGDIQEAVLLANDIRENEEKINTHGKRADNIVKSMLQHSRGSSGVKEPTDLNKLVDEYVRLAYHGYRARKKEFTVKLEVDPDPEIGKVNIVAQDIGRVLLNLLNNAFYAVQEKSRTAGEAYSPAVTIRTRRYQSAAGARNQVSVSVMDNGMGMPVSVQEKIFQPFFTTKPTGQGTGLGLSLSYDIVTKGNGGTLQVASREGEGTEMTMTLPVD